MYGQINVVNTISNTNRRQVDPKTSQLGCKLPRRGVQSRCFHFSFNIFLSKRLSAPASGCSIAQYVQPTQCLIHTQGTQFVHVVIENKYVVSQIYFSSAMGGWGVRGCPRYLKNPGYGPGLTWAFSCSSSPHQCPVSADCIQYYEWIPCKLVVARLMLNDNEAGCAS